MLQHVRHRPSLCSESDGMIDYLARHQGASSLDSKRAGSNSGKKHPCGRYRSALNPAGHSLSLDTNQMHRRRKGWPPGFGGGAATGSDAAGKSAQTSTLDEAVLMHCRVPHPQR
jgi:hypothetical protein